MQQRRKLIKSHSLCRHCFYETDDFQVPTGSRDARFSPRKGIGRCIVCRIIIPSPDEYLSVGRPRSRARYPAMVRSSARPGGGGVEAPPERKLSVTGASRREPREGRGPGDDSAGD